MISCKKYEDGPMISLRSAKSRVVANWNATFWTNNNKDCLHDSGSDYYNCSLGYDVWYQYSYDYTSVIYRFSDNGTFTYSSSYNYTVPSDYSSCEVTYQSGNSTESGGGTWKLQSNNTELSLLYTGDNTYCIFSITELKEKEMAIEGNISGEQIKMIFEKI